MQVCDDTILHSFQGITTDSQWFTVQLDTELLMIQNENTVVQFLDATSLPKYDTDTMLLQVATVRLAEVLRGFLSFYVVLQLLYCLLLYFMVLILNNKINKLR